jgi:hypothetical protein
MAGTGFSGNKGTRYLAHAGPVAAGLALMFVGTMVGAVFDILLIGIPVGLLGLLFFLWGVFGHVPE